MSVQKVKLVRLIGPNNKLDSITKICAESGMFQPDNAIDFYNDTKKFVPVSGKNILSDSFDRLKNCLNSAGIQPKTVDISDFSPASDEALAFVENFCKELDIISAEKNNAVNELAQYNKRYEEASHFLNSEFDISRLGDCNFVKSKFGKLPKESYKMLSMYNNPHILFSVLSQDDKYYWGVYVTPNEYCDEAERTFSSLGYIPVEIETLHESSHEFNEESRKSISDELNEKIAIADKKLNDFMQDKKEDALKYYSYLQISDKLDEIKSMAVMHNKSFIFVGWITEENEEKFLKLIKKEDNIECTVTNGKDEMIHSPPIHLKNPRIFKPFEFYVDMFGLPAYGEMDPTVFVGITYTLLFGVMFADLGQGLVLSLVGYLMWKLKKMALGKILVPCGISAAVFGFVFGSVFGLEHLLDPVFKMMGFEEKPIEVMESSTINAIVYAAVIIGVSLVVAAMLLNVYSSFKQRDIARALFDSNGIAGMLFYSSLVFGLVSTIFFGNNVFSTAYIVGLIIIPLILMFLREPLDGLIHRHKNWQPESWGEYFMQSFFEMFETMLSYVSNTMSFLRVGAFVLVHTGMMMVVSILAGEPSSASYIPVMIVGNIVVLALEGLLVGIQVLRLEFYEMFSRFYTGSGRAFKPIDIKSK